MERRELTLSYDLSRTPRPARETVKIEGDFGPAGKPILSLRLLPVLPAKPGT